MHTNAKSKSKLQSSIAMILLVSAGLFALFQVAIPTVQAQTYPFADYFTMDANNPTPALQGGWSTFQTSYVGSQTQTLNNSLGLILAAKSTNTHGATIGYGLEKSSSLSLSGTLSLVLSELKYTSATANVQTDFYLADSSSTTAIPSCGNRAHFLHLYLSTSGIAKVDTCNAGTLTNRYTGTSAQVYSVWTINQNSGTVSNVYLDTGSGSISVWTGAALGFTTGYVYILESTTSTSTVNAASQFFVSTTGDGLTTTAIGRAVGYMSRAYSNIFTAAQSPTGQPMSVIRDVPSIPIELKDTVTGTVRQLGEAGVTVQPWCPLGDTACELTNLAYPVGTRLLFANTTYQDALVSFTANYGNQAPDVILEIQVWATNTISQKISLKELYYSSNDNISVYLSGYLVFSGNHVGSTWTQNNSHFGFMSNRYVGRHMTEVMAQVFSQLGYSTQATYLQNFVNYYLGSSYQDYYAPMSGSDAGYPDYWLISSNAFPDAALPHTLPTKDSYPYDYPYQSRLTLPCVAAVYAYGSNDVTCPFIYGLNSQILECLNWQPGLGYVAASFVPPATDLLLADKLAHKYGTSNTTNLGYISQLVSAAGWDGLSLRRDLLWAGYGQPVTCGSVFASGKYSYPSNPGYSLAVFLGVTSDLYKLTGSSTYLNDAQQAASVMMGIQVPGSASIKGYGGTVQLPDSVGGSLLSYLPTPSYEFSSHQVGLLTDLSSFLYSNGFFGIQPNEWSGISTTDTEATGLALLALLDYNADVATPVVPQIQGTSVLPSSTIVTNSGTASGNVSPDYYFRAQDSGTWTYSYPPGWFSNVGTSFTTEGVKSLITLSKTTVQPIANMTGLLNATISSNVNEPLCQSSPCHDGRANLNVYAKVYSSGGGLLATNWESVFAAANYTGSFNTFVNYNIPFPNLQLSAGTYTLEVGFNFTAYGTTTVTINPRTQIFKAFLTPATPYPVKFATGNFGAENDDHTFIEYAAGRTWIFYSDNTCIQARSTIDGVHFTAPVQMTCSLGSDNANGLSVSHSGSTGHYVLQEINYAFNTIYNAVWSRTFTMNSDGTVSLGTEYQVIVSSFCDGGATTAFDTNGNFWIANTEWTGVQFQLDVGTIGGSTFSHSITYTDHTLGQVVPLTSGKVGLVRGDNGGVIAFSVYSSGTWGSSTATSNLGYSLFYSKAASVPNSDSIYVAASKYYGSGGVDLLNYTGGSIRTTAVDSSTTAWYASLSMLSTSIPSQPDLAVFYGAGSTLKLADNALYGGTTFTYYTLSTSESSIANVNSSPDVQATTYGELLVTWSESTTPNLWYGGWDF